MSVVLRLAVCAALAAVCCSTALAQKPGAVLPPGEYVADGGVVHLLLKPAIGGVQTFTIETSGGNGHTCSLEGEARYGRAELEGMEDKVPCIVTMGMTPQGIDVKGAPYDACRFHCGMRATFEMLYFQPAPACAGKAVATTRKAFKRSYDAQQFQQARALLEPVLSDCARSLDWTETGRIRNDLAVTLHKLGDLAACRAVLAPLAEDAALSDAGLRENYAPNDVDLVMPIVRATRTNLRLCK